MTTPDPVARRAFLGLTAALASACAASSRPTAAAASLSSADPWDAVQARFPLSRDYVHLSSFLFASHPKAVAEAIEKHRRAFDANPALVVENEMTSRENSTRVRTAAAGYIGALPNEIALTDSTTTGIATLYNGMRLAPGDEILSTTHDHYVTQESLRLVAERTGATVRKAKLYEDAAAATVEGMTQALMKELTPRTRVVAITWVHSSTGVKTPVRAIADALAAAQASRDPKDRAVLCVDGVHGFGVEDVTMGDLGCDFFVSGCHKWLYGPRGTGLVWGRADALRKLRPTLPPFLAWDYVRARQYGGDVAPVDGWVMSPGGFKTYEYQWALPEAFAMHQEIGKARVQARIHELNRHLKEGLASMRHVKLHTPLSSAVSSGIVCFDVAGMKPGGVVERLLAAKIVASETPYRPSYARLGASLVNTHADVDAALRALRTLG